MELSQLTNANLIGVHREIRARKEKLVEEQREALKPFNEQLSNLEGELLRRMAEQDTNSFATDNGTAYKSVVSSVKVENSGAFMDYLQESGDWHLADVRAAKKEVEAYLEKEQALPPGLDISRVTKCGVRKPTGVK